MSRQPRTAPPTSAAATAHPPPPPGTGLTGRRAVVLVLLLSLVAFSNSFLGVFVYDDIQEIALNPRLERLLPPWEAMFIGNGLPARPLPYFTFAIDRAIWGTWPFGYHFLHVGIHAAAAVALFALVRITLRSPCVASDDDRATLLALVVAVVWAVHPLQTQAVTYVYQRIEALAGLFCLLSLLCYALAAADRSADPRRRRRWLAGSVAASAAAMASKEHAVVLPLLVLAYDWVFVSDGSGGVRGWLSRLWERRGFWLGLASTWIVLLGILLYQSDRYQEFSAKHADQILSPHEYFLTQLGVVVHYLRLSVWPVGQQFEYGGWPVARSLADVLPQAVLLAGLGLAAAVGAMRRRPAGYVGLAFFLCLAPTSSVLPVEAVASEHRMYLPLAAVVVLVVVGGATVVERLAVRFSWPSRPARVVLTTVTVAVVAALMLLTLARNQLYSTRTGVWFDVLAKNRGNYRAYEVMAHAVDAEGDVPLAMEMAREAMVLRPESSCISDIARMHLRRGNVDLAKAYLRFGYDTVRSLVPEDAEVCQKYALALAAALREAGEFAEVRSLCEGVLAHADAVHPFDAKVLLMARTLLAGALLAADDVSGADRLSATVLDDARRDFGPGDVQRINAQLLRADVLLRAGRKREAEVLLSATVREVRAMRFRSFEQESLLGSALDMLRHVQRVDLPH